MFCEKCGRMIHPSMGLEPSGCWQCQFPPLDRPKVPCLCPANVCPTHGTLDKSELRQGRRVRNK